MDGTAPQNTHLDDAYFGEILDCDAHLYMEPHILAGVVGEIGAGFVLEFIEEQFASAKYQEERSRAPNEVWNVKGLAALGAFSAKDRVKSMDVMGVKAQLVFPNTALRELRIDSDAARAACRRYNDYAVDWTKDTNGRARVMCQINMGQVDWAMEELDRVIKKGASGVLLSCAAAPANVSPAHDCWDPFWARLAEANVPAMLHLSSGGLVTSDPGDPVIPPRQFSDARSLKASFEMRPGAEEAIGPYFMLVAHMPCETYLVTLLMGGVFERHPNLRFGIIECGAGWVGGMADRMETHADLMAKVGITYSMRPSEFLRRNVRVTPFWHENVDRMIARDGMEEIYVFSTDFPHVEGTRDPIGRFKKTTTRGGDAYDRKFFIENAKLLFPDL